MFHHIIQILRTYLNIDQNQLADMAHVAPSDIDEMERNAPFGSVDKYICVAKALGVSVHTLLTNDFAVVPESFFAQHEPSYRDHVFGIERKGQEAALHLEQERFQGRFETLDKLVLPCFKLPNAEPGFDILSYDDTGKRPIYIVVKTSKHGPEKSFHLTVQEYEVAQKVTATGYDYKVYRYVYWGKPEQELYVQSFRDMVDGHQMAPSSYTCTLKPSNTEVSGIAHFRELKGMTQEELALKSNLHLHQIYRYECGVCNCPADALLKLSVALDVTVDELLKNYLVSETICA